MTGIEGGVPQGSFLGLKLVIYINDIADMIDNCSIHLFTNDTPTYVSSKETMKWLEGQMMYFRLFENGATLIYWELVVKKTKIFINSQRKLVVHFKQSRLEIKLDS